MGLELALNDLARVDGKRDDGRLPPGLRRRYLHLIDEKAVSQMNPIKEADRGYRRVLRVCVFYYVHLFKNLAQIVADVIMMRMNTDGFCCFAIGLRVVDE